MTEGHKHRMVDVGSMDRWYVRPLRVRLWHRFCTVGDPTWEKVDKSPYPYGACTEHKSPAPGLWCFTLTPLGILHRWTGLTLRTPE